MEIALPVPMRYQYFYHVAFQAGNAFAETVIFHREITMICVPHLNSGINFRGSEALACVKSCFWRCGRHLCKAQVPGHLSWLGKGFEILPVPHLYFFL